MEILEQLWNTHVHYKGMRVNLFGFPQPWALRNKRTQNSARSTISRLKKSGFVILKSGQLSLTPAGKTFFESKRRLGVKFVSPFKSSDPKNLLLMFDIPESRKAERDWVRWHLKHFKYVMVQKSVWVGPSPLPRKFKDHTNEIGLNKFIRTFKLAKSYTVAKY